jgi:hypothetical protein
MHTIKNNKMLKFIKITPTCFRSVDPSSGSNVQCTVHTYYGPEYDAIALTTTIVSMHIVP